ncbi:sensor domain-containing protein [Mycolicibacterium sp. S2-37]|uniref:sensor domain-containing protein n=1 Tax=Mycolicibacterium sp. S2-37 TaxID=2810297 RepID=UPI001A948982|nr:sensor domain-containing protein [Mycolicibacterium sp. S2-37]MBO0677312.1 sensor domain-containing protein [Mycolicibacterium sp. S2-37]
MIARALLSVVAVLTTGCVSLVGGTAVRPVPGLDDDSRSPVDVDMVLLEQAQMQAITGAGDDLSIIPSMDGKIPVDIEPLMKTVASQCAWVFAESQTFGDEVEEFHKTSFQYPPEGGLISQGAAGYRDAETARRAFDGLVTRIGDCEATADGPGYVGTLTVATDSVQTRPGACGRDYRVKSAVLVEVTFCSFSEAIPDIVMTNILAKVPE